ncbi:MAG: hypothetical protein P4L69_07030 [Desulfosporosinus sp.]|nr:hypothetical protein [Desulfosporosinus sp.]
MALILIKPDNTFGEYEYKKGKDSLGVLQRLVKGNISLVNAGDNFVGYVDDEGLMKDDQGQNELGAYVLNFLGNDLKGFVGGLVRGPLVLLRPNDRPLSDKQTAAFLKLCGHIMKHGYAEGKKIPGTAILTKTKKGFTPY